MLKLKSIKKQKYKWKKILLLNSGTLRRNSNRYKKNRKNKAQWVRINYQPNNY